MEGAFVDGALVKGALFAVFVIRVPALPALIVVFMAVFNPNIVTQIGT